MRRERCPFRRSSARTPKSGSAASLSASAQLKSESPTATFMSKPSIVPIPAGRAGYLKNMAVPARMVLYGSEKSSGTRLLSVDPLVAMTKRIVL